MNNKLWAPVVLIILLFVLTSVPSFTEDKSLSLESKILESFEDDPVTGETLLSRWIVRPSKFVKTYIDLNDNKEKKDLRIARVNTWPQALHGKNKEGLPLYCLGFTTSFTRKGYNYVEIMPSREYDPQKDVREFIEGKDNEGDVVFTKCDKKWVSDREKIIYVDQAGKEWVSDPIVFEGRTKALSVWAWGANFNYYFEVHLEDHRGIVHVLPLGDLTFTGWKNLTIEIPSAIPQAEKYIPKLRRLKLIKFMVWTRPDERVSGFYMYLDQIKILTDIFETRYDGDELEDSQKIQEIWGECY
ncbi:MAG: flagellar filament outer layer protein FlaA [Spirochaetales bacterium]|nr:flagellar filament outer layer protein FlaA [Spirochaetales bacterium]